MKRFILRLVPAPLPAALPAEAPPEPAPRAGVYRRALGGAFGVFNTLRFVSYLPMIWTICQSGASQQHSLWTWGIWLGANATMAAWLYEAEPRMNRVLLVSLMNAAMCAATFVVILAYR